MIILQTLGYFFLALFLLITVHEFGHFAVARFCNVKVLRFSFGFGKILKSWHDKKGTEFAWSLLPLGGYVKMLDESESEVSPNERHLAFNTQSLNTRIAIVSAGPLFNFIFAFLLLWLILVIGSRALAPIVQTISPTGAAAQAGLGTQQEIIAINGLKTNSWKDVQYAIIPLMGSTNAIKMTVKSLKDGTTHTVTFPSIDWHLDAKHPDMLDALGIVPFIPRVPLIVNEVMPDSPGATAGLQAGDLIRNVQGKKINDWMAFLKLIKNHPNQTINLQVLRKGQLMDLSVHVGSKVIQGVPQGFIGVRSKPIDWPHNWLRVTREKPGDAIVIAFNQTIRLIKDTFISLGQLALGKLPLQSLSGPVGIATAAGESARGGLTEYLSFLALLSISLGVINLLPIPMLDGGNLLYYLCEAIVRRPLSEKIKSTGAFFGLFCMIALMLLALSNDINRLIG